jgi:hypothetical protein
VLLVAICHSSAKYALIVRSTEDTLTVNVSMPGRLEQETVILGERSIHMPELHSFRSSGGNTGRLSIVLCLLCFPIEGSIAAAFTSAMLFEWAKFVQCCFIMSCSFG